MIVLDLSFFVSISSNCTQRRNMSFRKLAEKAAAIDAFPKVEDDNEQRSEKGGLLTVLVALCLIMLTMSEFSE
jgi:hypothetical protein